MKMNMPVTDHEVLMEKGTILVTRTDLKGRITYANDAFVKISGFTRKQLIGSNHNLVRHPDMPSAAFEDLWACLKSQVPWIGLVKNRTATGDYYWVEANVIPVFDQGKAIEYLSVRQTPKREQVLAAEALYKKLNANQASIRPTGMAAKLKAVKEMPLGIKCFLPISILFIPVTWLILQLFQQQAYFSLGLVTISAIAAMWMTYSFYKLINGVFESSINSFYALASGYFRNKVDIDRGDVIGDLNRSFQAMQVKMNADLAASIEEGNNSSRIKQALDQVTGNVMMADANYNIIYMNNSAIELFYANEADFRKDLPDFESRKLVGTNIDIFHKNPAHQRNILDALQNTLSAELIIGGRTMVVIATPVMNDSKERLGTVVEWIDKTSEVNIQGEIEGIISAVKAGKLHDRLEMQGKTDFFKQLSQGINELADTIEATFSDVGQVMQNMSQGDLTKGITNDYDGVYDECKKDINTTINKLSEVFTQVRESADFINNSSHEIASGNNNLSQRAEQQASSLEETASSMEELTSTVQNNADNAQQADQLASTARQLAEKGGNVVTHAVSAMDEINVSSNKIAEIIGVIDEIAFQTNLLALNASVEAARAGEQGRGFSVVATEVRNLAQRSATAAKESKELIQNSLQKVRSGTEFVNETGKSLDDIVKGVKKVGDIIAEIAAASKEQASGIEQVNQAITQMDEITQQNAALAEQASAASVSMSEQSTAMVKQLDFFKTSEIQSQMGRQVEMPVRQQSSAAMTQTAEVEVPRSERRQSSVASAIPESKSTSADDEWEEF